MFKVFNSPIIDVNDHANAVNEDEIATPRGHSSSQSSGFSESAAPSQRSSFSESAAYTPTTPENSMSPQSLSSDRSSEPRRFRLLSDIYDNTEEVVLEDELLFVGTVEPTNYKQAVGEPAWEQAMKTKIEAIEKNKT